MSSVVLVVFTISTLLLQSCVVYSANVKSKDNELHPTSLVEVQEKAAQQAGLKLPPFDELPSMSPTDGLDSNLVNPLANPRPFPGEHQSLPDNYASRLASLPSAETLLDVPLPPSAPTSFSPPQLGDEMYSNEMRLTPSHALPPIVLGMSVPSTRGLPNIDGLSFPINTNLPGLSPPNTMRHLVPPNPNWNDPSVSSAVSSPSAYLNYAAERKRLVELRRARMGRMTSRSGKINHFKSYVDGGEAWISKMEDQLNKWLQQERQRGSKSIVAEHQQVGSYKKVLGSLMAKQQNDARQVNLINAQLKKLHTQYKLEQQRKRLQNALEEQKQLQNQLQLSGKRKQEMEKRMKELNSELNKIQTGVGKVAGKGKGKGGKGKGGKAKGGKAKAKGGKGKGSKATEQVTEGIPEGAGEGAPEGAGEGVPEVAEAPKEEKKGKATKGKKAKEEEVAAAPEF